MVLSSRLGGVKDALLLIANPLKHDWRWSLWNRACSRLRRFSRH
jgi:hypothetical protein